MTPSHELQCPAAGELVEWFDGVLAAPDIERIETHLERCHFCRALLLSWSERSGAGLPVDAPGESADCLDPESMVAYATASEGAGPAETSAWEHHLHQCDRCTTALQRVMLRQGQMEPREATSVEFPLTSPVPASGSAGRISDWLSAARAWLEGTFAIRPVIALATVLLFAIGLSRFVGSNAEYEDRQVRDLVPAAIVELLNDTQGYARPDRHEPIVAQLARGTQARWIENSEGWTRIELLDGRRVWVERASVSQVSEQ